MKTSKQKKLYIGAGSLVLFIVWTAALFFVDVKEIGPLGTSVGFASLNEFVHNITGVHMWMYSVTDWLGLVPIFCIMGFAILGLIQWIQRKSILKVDFSILALGAFCIIVILAYVLFEVFVLNYRPILINGNLEASYPSSTTMLVLCVMPAVMMQFNFRIKCLALKRCVSVIIAVFIVFMVFGRLISGVHWFSDIIGGVLVSEGLVKIYSFICSKEGVS